MVLEVIHGDLDGQDRHRTPPRPLRKSASLLRAPSVLEQLKNSKISDEKFKNVLFALEQTLFLSVTHSYAALQCNKIILCGARARRARAGDQRNINSADLRAHALWIISESVRSNSSLIHLSLLKNVPCYEMPCVLRDLFPLWSEKFTI